MITVLGKLKKMMDQFLQIVAQDSNETGDKVKGSPIRARFTLTLQFRTHLYTVLDAVRHKGYFL